MEYNIELLKTQLLPDFPSGSSLNYRDDTLYLIGDDANSILILDKNYSKISSVQLFNYPGKRIPKPMKADLEASVFITNEGLDYLLIVGSGATEQREKIILVPLIQSRLNNAEALTIPTRIFTSRMRSLGIPEVNLEGATAFNETLAVSNRGNRKNITNHIILTNVDFWKRQDEADLNILPVKISLQRDDIIGISEICYVKETDTLLISFSSEHTDNAYDDGTIGHSYVGWVDNISQKIKEPSLIVERLINLSEVHDNFKNEKIEGLCVESVNGNEMLLHLVSDNDKGQSKLFKVRVTMCEQC